MITTAIQQLVNYGLDTGLILPDDEIYIRNQLLMTMQLDDFTAPEGEVCYTDLESILKKPQPVELAPPQLRPRNLDLDEKELQKIIEREFGPEKRTLYRPIPR